MFEKVKRGLKPAATAIIFKTIMIIEKKHRLHVSCYRGYIRASFTLCVNQRHPVFLKADIVKEVTNIFAVAIKKYCCVNLVYLFMPDHFHCILEGIEHNANLWRAMVLFKQISGYWFAKNLPDIKWQKGFFDHVHRKEEDLKRQVLYILDNPVRNGLVKHWRDYQHKGSLDFILEEIIF